MTPWLKYFYYLNQQRLLMLTALASYFAFCPLFPSEFFFYFFEFGIGSFMLISCFTWNTAQMAEMEMDELSHHVSHQSCLWPS